MDLYDGYGFLAGDSDSVSWTGGVFSEEQQPGPDASYLTSLASISPSPVR